MVSEAREILLFQHNGVSCMVSADEVHAIHRTAEDHEELSLWRTDAPSHPAEIRFLEVSGANQVVRANNVRARVRGGLTTATIPPLLRRVLPRQVVGVVDIDNATHWVLRLIDTE